ncbi:MAG: PAS domain S-box protein [bacterium]
MTFRNFLKPHFLLVFLILFVLILSLNGDTEQVTKMGSDFHQDVFTHLEGNIFDANAARETFFAKASSFGMLKENKGSLYIVVMVFGILVAALLLGKNYLAGPKRNLRKMEEALLASGKRYVELANLLPGIVFEADVEGNITFANQKAFDIMGYAPEDIEDGLNIFQFIAPEQLPEAKEIFKETLLEEKSSLRLILQKKDGSRFPALVYTSPIFRNGHPFGLRGLVVDITDLARIQEELLKSEEKFRKLAEETKAIAEICQIISSSSNIEEIYERFAQKLGEIISFDRIAMNIIDREKKEFFIPYTHGVAVPGREGSRLIPMEGTASEWVIKNKKGLLINEDNLKEFLRECPALNPFVDIGLKSMIFIPMISRGQVIGVLSFQSFKKFAYGEKDLEIAEKVSNQIAGAVANAILFKKQKETEEVLLQRETEARKLAQEKEILAQIGRLISSTLYIEEVYEGFASKVKELIPFDRISINVVDNENGTVRISYVSGKTVLGHSIRDVVPLAGSLSKEVITRRKGMVFHPVSEEEVIFKFPQLLSNYRSGLKSVMMVPLISKGQVVATISFMTEPPNAYKEADLRLAEDVANQIAGAVANALLFEEWKRAEESLRNSELKYRELVSSLPEVVFEADEAGNLTFVNERAFEIFGYTKDDFAKGLNVFEMIAPEDLERGKEFYKKEMHGEKTGREYKLLKKDGSVFPGIIYTKPIIQNGIPSGLRGIIIDITDRKNLEEHLKESRERYKTLFENTGTAFIVIEEDMTISLANSKVEELTGYSRKEIEGEKKWTEFIVPEYLKKLQEYHRLRRTNPDLAPRSYEAKFKTKKGEIKEILINVAMIPGTKRSIASLFDITEQKRKEKEIASLQEQFIHSQKMEAIGRLASGVAHDFNNSLTIVKVSAQFAQAKLKPDDPLREYIDMIIEAIDRSANLSRQLLAFSRKQVMEMKVIDLNALIKDLDKMLHRMIGEDIELIYQLAEDLKKVKVDPGQIEQVILNLTLNSRDAMPQGGKLLIETANVELDENYVKTHLGAKAGQYVLLSVTDTGIGMTPEVKEHLFEPFFTTKEKGKGTGLGLSTVYGIVKQSGGYIWVFSEPGQGTTFKIYLPAVDEPAEEIRRKEAGGRILRGNETIMVVEDEEEVRKLAGMILERMGYKVLLASCADEAFDACEKYKEPIHLLLTDVILPGMSGRDLAEGISILRPNIKVLYMSGYPDNVISDHGVLKPGINYLPKPFTVEGLTRKVREVLDRS